MLTLLLFLPIGLPSLVLAQELLNVQPEAVGMSSERLQRLDATLQSYVDAGRLAGQVALVMRKGQIVYSTANGWRNRGEQLPMEADTIFRIASQTKAIVSTGIMILQERGALDINQPLSRFIPEWSQVKVAESDGEGGYNVVPAKRQITLRHLLTHTSGISYGSGPASAAWQEANMQGWYFANREEPIAETIARMASLPIDAHPGEQWIYGYNTDILGVVIEKVSGKNLAEFLQEEILDPLGMKDTHFYLPPEKIERLAVVYQPRRIGGVEAIAAKDGMQSQGFYVEGPRTSYSGGAGLLSTARDYARFLQMTLNGGEFNGKRIVSPKTIELMTSNHLADIPYQSGVGFGLGFSIATDLGARGTLGSQGEYGWGGAYHSTYWVDPQEELVVVYMTQLIPANGLDDYSKLRNGIYQAIIE